MALSRGSDMAKMVHARLMAEPGQGDAVLAKLAYPPRVHYVSAYMVMAENRCPLIDAKGEPRQFDYGHLTASGSYCLAGEIGKSLLPFLPAMP